MLATERPVCAATRHPGTGSPELGVDIAGLVCGRRAGGYQKGRHVDPQLAAEAISAGDSPLTPREVDVLEFAGDGASI
jgi:hypothetical protein